MFGPFFFFPAVLKSRYKLHLGNIVSPLLELREFIAFFNPKFSLLISGSQMGSLRKQNGWRYCLLTTTIPKELESLVWHFVLYAGKNLQMHILGRNSQYFSVFFFARHGSG